MSTVAGASRSITIIKSPLCSSCGHTEVCAARLHAQSRLLLQPRPSSGGDCLQLPPLFPCYYLRAAVLICLYHHLWRYCFRVQLPVLPHHLRRLPPSPLFLNYHRPAAIVSICSLTIIITRRLLLSAPLAGGNCLPEATVSLTLVGRRQLPVRLL